MSNTSDAYMELSDPDVWGETYDAQFGMGPQGRKLGAFEIASFSFGVTPDHADAAARGTGGKTAAKAHDSEAPKARPASDGTHHDGKIHRYSKYIDKGSPDLFLACLKKDQIQWAIISIRESGEAQRKPFLVLEFTKVTVDSFQWDLNPGDAEGAATMETVEFSFQTVLIKYSRQEKGGEHVVVKMKGWNRETHTSDVAEIDPRLGAGIHEDQSSLTQRAIYPCGY